MPAKRKEDKVADADTITINRAEYQQSRDGVSYIPFFYDLPASPSALKVSVYIRALW